MKFRETVHRCILSKLFFLCSVTISPKDTLALHEERNGTRLDNTSPSAGVLQGSLGDIVTGHV